MDLTGLAAELENAAKVPPAAVQQVVADSATRIRDQLRAEAAASRHFGKIAPTITSDVKAVLGGGEAEIGPEKRGQGNLAVIAYFGGSHGGGGTLPDPSGALNDAIPGFEASLARLVGL